MTDRKNCCQCKRNILHTGVQWNSTVILSILIYFLTPHIISLLNLRVYKEKTSPSIFCCSPSDPSRSTQINEEKQEKENPLFRKQGKLMISKDKQNEQTADPRNICLATLLSRRRVSARKWQSYLESEQRLFTSIRATGFLRNYRRPTFVARSIQLSRGRIIYGWREIGARSKVKARWSVMSAAILPVIHDGKDKTRFTACHRPSIDINILRSIVYIILPHLFRRCNPSVSQRYHDTGDVKTLMLTLFTYVAFNCNVVNLNCNVEFCL